MEEEKGGDDWTSSPRPLLGVHGPCPRDTSGFIKFQKMKDGTQTKTR